MLTAGGKTKLSRKKEAAVAALISAPTIAAAAAAVGIHEITLWRWLRQPEFKAAYEEAKRQALEAAIKRLQAVSGQAVETLHEVMTDPTASPHARVAAARTVLEMALKAYELQDLASRVEALETEFERRAL